MALPLTQNLTDIANLALATIGDHEINNIEDLQDQTAKRIRRILPEVIRQVQYDIQWQELIVFTSPIFKTDSYKGAVKVYQYPMPPNFLDVIQVDTVTATNGGLRFDEDQKWYLEAKHIITNKLDPVVTYKKYSENVSDWTGYLVELIYRKLAVEIAMPLTQDTRVLERVDAKYEIAWHKIVTKSQNTDNYEELKRVWFTQLSARYTGRMLTHGEIS